MSTDMNARLEEQLAGVQKEFDANAARIKECAGQRAGLDKQLNVLQARQSELRGEYQGLKKLTLEPVKDIPVEGKEAPEKASKKKD